MSEVSKKPTIKEVYALVRQYKDLLENKFEENFKKTNVSIYNHFGFNLLDEYAVPNTDLTLYSMLRQPS